MKTLIATTLITTSAHGALCTFENLPAPTLTDQYSQPLGVYYDGLYNYEGFIFTGSYPGDSRWYYYDLVGGPGYLGYDEGIIGDRAIFTPYGSSTIYDWRISRDELWRLNNLEITSAWSTMTVVIQGYRYGEVVYTYTTQLNPAQRVNLNISSAYPGPVNHITQIKVYGIGGGGGQIIIDNIEYTVVPAPASLSLLGVAGIIRKRSR